MQLKINKKNFDRMILSLDYTCSCLIEAMQRKTTTITEGKRHLSKFRKLRDLLMSQKGGR